jgi:hypothetical protein
MSTTVSHRNVEIFPNREDQFVARRKLQIHDGAIMRTPICELVRSVCGNLGAENTA